MFHPVSTHLALIMSRWFLRSLLVGLVSIISVPPLSSGLAWTYAICFTYTAPYRTMRVPFVCSDIFLFQEEEIIRETLFLVYLFRSYVPLAVLLPVIASSLSPTLTGWIEPSCALRFPFCKRPYAQRNPNSTRFLKYDSIISPALHVDLNLASFLQNWI